MSAEVCIVATRPTEMSAAAAGGANPRTAAGRAFDGSTGGSALRAASAIAATENPNTTFETAARSADRLAVASSRQESTLA